MANAVTTQATNYGRPRSPQLEFNTKLTIDTITANEVDIAALLDALPNTSDWKKADLDLDDVLYANCHCDASTEGAKYLPRYDQVNKTLHLVKSDGSGLATGSIPAVEVFVNFKFK